MACSTVPQPVPCPKCGYLTGASGTGDGFANFCPKCGRGLRHALEEERTLSDALIGHVLADRYRLMSLVGEGGVGAVYKAEHIRIGKVLAVKVLRGAFRAEPEVVARFRADAQIVSRLSHRRAQSPVEVATRVPLYPRSAARSRRGRA